MNTTAEQTSVEDSYVFGASLKIAATAIIVTYVASFVYGLSFGLFSWNQLLGFLNSEHMSSALSQMGLEANHVIAMFLGLTTTPVSMAAITASFPFLGAWIYLGVPQNKTTAVGLTSLLFFGATNLLVNLVFSSTIFSVVNGLLTLIAFVLGVLVVLLYGFLVMGIGYNAAKIFKLKPNNDSPNLNSF